MSNVHDTPPSNVIELRARTAVTYRGSMGQSAQPSWMADISALAVDDISRAWLAQSEMLSSDDAVQWLETVGGLSMKQIGTEFELLVMANNAPNDLLFGLAYGKLCDAMAHRLPVRTTAHHIAMTFGPVSAVHEMVSNKVLVRGIELATQTQETDPEFANFQSANYSNERRSLLVGQASVAPDTFALGQLTSWLITHDLVSRPEVAMNDDDQESSQIHRLVYKQQTAVAPR